MANKAGLISAVNGFITAIVTVIKHRASILEMINEFYSEVIHEEKTNLVTIQSITIDTVEGNHYYLDFCKQGRKVSVKGTLINKQSAIVSNTGFLEIVDSDFFPYTSLANTNSFYGNASNDNRPIKLIFAGNELVLAGSSLGVGQNVNVDFEYFTQN